MIENKDTEIIKRAGDGVSLAEESIRAALELQAQTRKGEYVLPAALR